MLGWFEWDEANQRLRVVIPPWDCVDAPRQSDDVLKQRKEALLARLKLMDLTPMQRGAINDYLGVAAQWIPEELFEFALETVICFAKTDASLFESVVSFQALVSPPFNDLVRAGHPCQKEIDGLVALAILMSRTTRRVYLSDQVSRTREKLHDDHGLAEPHASINHLLARLEALLLIAPPDQEAPMGVALIPAQADQLNTQVRRLLRRMVFSMDSVFHEQLAANIDALVKAERQGIFHHVAQDLEPLASDVPLFAICEPLWVQIHRVAGCNDRSELPDSPTLAREVLDQADAWITACAGVTYRYTRTHLIGLGNRQPTSPQLLRSHELLTRHTRAAAQQRLNQRQRWLSGPAPTSVALTVATNPGAPDADDPVHTWPVERLVRWINGPVTSKGAAKALANQDKLLNRDNELLAQDRQRSGAPAPAKGKKDSQALTKAQAQEVVWQGLILSAEYLRDELRDLGALADSLNLQGTDRNNARTALKGIETALQAMGGFKRTTTIDKAQAQLAQANSCLEQLRSAIKPVQVAADRLLRFGDCLVQQLRQETLAMGKRHGEVIGCPMALDQWAAVRDRFHQRYCSVAQALTMGGERVLLRSDQALALHVTAGSQSGYAFDVSVHLWQRLDESKNDPFDTSSVELFPPMDTQAWFDTFITCAVLHVPLR